MILTNRSFLFRIIRRRFIAWQTGSAAWKTADSVRFVKRGVFAEPQTVGQAKLVGCNNISEIDWISEDRVYAKNWNLSLRVPFTEPEEQKKYRAIAIYPGDITLYSEDAILEEKQVRNKISVKSCGTEEELHSWAVSCQIDGTDAELMMLYRKKKCVGTGKKLQKSLWMAERSICCSKDDAICFKEV